MKSIPPYIVCVCVYVCVLQDISSLIHSMYEVLEVSVKQPCSDNTPLKIKLAVSPSACPDKISQTGKMKSWGSKVSLCQNWSSGIHSNHDLMICPSLIENSHRKGAGCVSGGREPNKETLLCGWKHRAQKPLPGSSWHWKLLFQIWQYRYRNYFFIIMVCANILLNNLAYCFISKNLKLKWFPPFFSRVTLSRAQTAHSLCSSAPPSGRKRELHLLWVPQEPLYPSLPEK